MLSFSVLNHSFSTLTTICGAQRGKSLSGLDRVQAVREITKQPLPHALLVVGTAEPSQALRLADQRFLGSVRTTPGQCEPH